jgi:hypothetical protein
MSGPSTEYALCCRKFGDFLGDTPTSWAPIREAVPGGGELSVVTEENGDRKLVGAPSPNGTSGGAGKKRVTRGKRA